MFDLQEKLSRRIVEALKVTLAPDEDRHLASRDIPDVEAFALYLRARQEFLKMTEASFDLAERLVDRALARTGPNALLLATAAWAAAYVLAEIGRTSQARELGDMARALDPLYWPAPAGSMLADVFDGRFDSALAKVTGMHTASGGNPVADMGVGICLLYAGRPGEAAAAFDRMAAAGAGPIFCVRGLPQCLGE